ncbi:MAG: dTMP kinase, partial [Alphaproteobacteria bacterium]
MFISFEGGEGTGKSTQIRRLAGFLERRGKSVVVLREPGGAPGAEAIRTLLLNGDPDRWDAIEELLLFSAARHELVRTKIKPALEQGSWVLCDRYADSSAVYQGRAGGVPA